MKWILALAMFVHGFAHLVGFVVPWRLAAPDDMPYKTTLLAGRLEVGSLGIRINGLLWLLTGVAFMAAGFALIKGAPIWFPMALSLAIFSLLLSILGIPEAKIGITVNAILIGILLLSLRLGWLGLG